MAEITGIDFSRYQYQWNESTGEMLRPMNFDTAKAAGVRFAAGRITIGPLVDWAYRYRTGYCSLKACQAAGIPTTGYHVVKPYYSVDAQISALFRAIDVQAFDEDFPLWLDCERPDGMPPITQTRIIVGCIERIYNECKYFPDIYTNVGYWDSNTVHDDIFNECNLIVANYTTASRPLVPREWRSLGGLIRRWKIWQYSADGNGLGPRYGAASHSIDVDRFNGDEAAFQTMLFKPAPVPVPDVGGDDLQTKFQVLIEGQAIRSEPSILGGAKTITGRLVKGRILYPARDIVIKSAGELWVKFDIGWVAGIHGGTQYLKAV
jgi:GH25 family lysozyme M1 (1,4-beta-N-acetylmuramidase)